MLQVVVCRNKRLRLDSHTYAVASRNGLLVGLRETFDNSVESHPFVLAGGSTALLRFIYQLTLEGEVRLV